MSARIFSALLLCSLVAGGSAMSISSGGRKLAQTLVDTSKLIALPTVTLPEVVLPQNIQVLGNDNSGNTKTDPPPASSTGRKLKQTLVNTADLVALPDVALPNVQFPQNVQVLANDNSGNTKTGRKLSQLIDASGTKLPTVPDVVLPQNIQVLGNKDSGNTDTTGRKLSQALIDASSLNVPKLPNVVLPQNIQVLGNKDSGNTDTTGSGR